MLNGSASRMLSGSACRMLSDLVSRILSGSFSNMLAGFVDKGQGCLSWKRNQLFKRNAGSNAVYQ